MFILKIYDISVVISPNMTVYKDYPHKKPVFTNVSNFETGSAYETDIKMNVHSGTHVDFNLHMLKDGNTSSNAILSNYITDAKVFDLTHLTDKIEADDLKELNIEKDDFVLFKTRNSNVEHFDFGFVYVTESAAKYLAEKQIKGVGVDALGIERDQPGHPTHKTLMNHNIVILEGLRLKDIVPQSYILIALPLKFEGLDGSPVRAVLLETV